MGAARQIQTGGGGVGVWGGQKRGAGRGQKRPRGRPIRVPAQETRDKATAGAEEQLFQSEQEEEGHGLVGGDCSGGVACLIPCFSPLKLEAAETERRLWGGV